MTLGAILGLKSLYYGLKSHVHEIIWSLRTNLENYRKIDFYLMRGYAQCAPAFRIFRNVNWPLTNSTIYKSNTQNYDVGFIVKEGSLRSKIGLG